MTRKKPRRQIYYALVHRVVDQHLAAPGIAVRGMPARVLDLLVGCPEDFLIRLGGFVKEQKQRQQQGCDQSGIPLVRLEKRETDQNKPHPRGRWKHPPAYEKESRDSDDAAEQVPRVRSQGAGGAIHLTAHDLPERDKYRDDQQEQTARQQRA